jgi:hypothetical protein
MAKADKRYLEVHGGKWRVTVPVPRDLQGKLGSTRLKRPLKTDSLTVANALKWPIVSEFRAKIEGARQGTAADPLRREAVEVAELRSRAVTDAEREMIEDAAVERAEQLQGDPLFVDPLTREEAFDPRREAQAVAYAAIALGRATPIDLHHAEFVAQSVTKMRTKADDQRALKFLLEWCERKQVSSTLQAITRRVAARFMGEMREVAGDQQPITLNKYLGRLSRYWQWLGQREYVEFDPWARLKVPAAPRNYEEVERAFIDHEMRALLNGPASPRMHDLMRIAALTGARLDTIVSLRIGDCADGLFMFKPQKREEKPRSVPIHSALADVITVTLRWRPPVRERAGGDSARGVARG